MTHERLIAIGIGAALLAGILTRYIGRRSGAVKSDFWVRAFSDDGEASFSRCASAFIIVNVVAWAWIVVIHTHDIPYIALVAATPFTLQFYVANVASKTVTKIATTTPGAQQPATTNGSVIQLNK